MRSGVRADMSPREVRAAELNNLAGTIGIVALVVFGTFVALVEQSITLVVTLSQLPLIATALWLNRRGRVFAATCTLAISGYAAWLAQPLLYGTAARYETFLLVLAAAAPLLFSDAHRTTAYAFVALASVTFVALVAFGDHIEPIVTLNPTTLPIRRGALALGTVALIAGISLYAQRATADAEAAAEREHAKSEALLKAILPSTIADRLKERPGEAIAERVDAVTVLFADMVGFTDACARVPPDTVVERLNAIFRAFDGIAAELGLEKIKTIGDAYMAAAGVPVPVDDHAERAAEMATRMLRLSRTLRGIDGGPLRLRIGLHTGPVVVGVIGREKPAYDLWGDTVNTASRMESSGIPGRIQVTREVVAALPARFRHEARGPIDVKGKGTIDTELLVTDDDEPKVDA